MGIKTAAIISLVGFAASAQAANACDLEGMGFTRINPFAQHAAWSTPAKQTPQEAEQRDAAPPQESTAQNQQAQSAEARKDSASASFTPVSADAGNRPSQRFTATKD